MTDFTFQSNLAAALYGPNAYEDLFRNDDFYDDLPLLKHAKNSYQVDVSALLNEAQDFDPISTDNKSQEPEETSDAFNSKAITFAGFSQPSESHENYTEVQRETDGCSKDDQSSTDKASDIVSEILGHQFDMNDDILNIIEQSITSENKKLMKILEKILKGGEITDNEYYSFSFFEQCIISGIFNKKKLASDVKKKQKREEEKQKLFFKAVLKQTDKEFFKEIIEAKKKIKRKTLDRVAYYELYWGETAKKKNVDLAYFFHPNKKIAMGNTDARTKYTQNPWVKSLNTSYIELILASGKFREVTLKYLENNFVQEYTKSRVKKISKMVNKLQVIAMDAVSESANFGEEQQREHVSNAILNYINTNPKCKLPWADFEINETKEYARSMILKQQFINEALEMDVKVGCNLNEFF